MIRKRNHTHVFKLLLPSLFLLFTFCGDKNPTQHQASEESKAIYQTVVLNQQEKYEVFETLIAEMDTVSALDSVRTLLEQDSLVAWAEIGEQGIAIQYENGIRGGIFIDPLDDLEEGNENFEMPLGKVGYNRSELTNQVPKTKKAIFINPSYWERKKYADRLIKNYHDYLSNAGFELTQIYKNSQATVERFTQLGDYGLIHIYSHGWAWPKKDNILEIYLQTGEAFSLETCETYLDDLYEDDIMIAYSKSEKKTLFLVSPQFIAKYNQFSENKPLFYGGFCFSTLGNWPSVMHDEAEVGGYFGFDWAVDTRANAYWNFRLIQTLTDTANGAAYTVNNWMNNNLLKHYQSKKHNRQVNLVYTGKSDLALMQKAEPAESVYNWGTVETQFTAYYYNEEDSSYQSVETEYWISLRLEGTFTNDTFTGSYVGNDSENPYEETLSIQLNEAHDKVVALTWTRSQRNEFWNIESEKIVFRAHSIPKDDAYYGLRYRVSGAETCSSISSISNVWREIDPAGWTHSLDYYECNSTDYPSYITVKLGKD